MHFVVLYGHVTGGGQIRFQI